MNPTLISAAILGFALWMCLKDDRNIRQNPNDDDEYDLPDELMDAIDQVIAGHEAKKGKKFYIDDSQTIKYAYVDKEEYFDDPEKAVNETTWQSAKVSTVIQKIKFIRPIERLFSMGKDYPSVFMYYGPKDIAIVILMDSYKATPPWDSVDFMMALDDIVLSGSSRGDS